MKKYMRRTALLLLVLLLLLPLACCKPDKLAYYEKLLAKHEGIISLKVWSYYNNEQAAAFLENVDKFNATVGKEKRIYVSSENHSGVSILTQAMEASARGDINAKPLPNIFQSYTDDLLMLNNKYDIAAPLQNYFDDEELDNYVDGFLSEGYFGDNLFIIPVAKSTEIFMLNLTDWNKFADEVNGVSLDDLNTVEGITEVAKKYYDWSGKAFFGRDAMANYILHSAASCGVELFGTSDGKTVFNADKDLFRKIYDNYYVPYVKGYFARGINFRSSDVGKGLIAGYVGSSASADYFPSSVRVDDDSTYKIDCHVSAVPLFQGAQKYAIQQDAGFAVTKSDEVTEYASSLFLKFLSDEQQNRIFAAEMGYVPVVKSALKYEEIKNDYISYNIEKLLNAEKLENTPDAIAAAKIKLEKEKSTVLNTFGITLDMVKEGGYTMYSAPPFEGSSEIRTIFEYCIQGDRTNAPRLRNLRNADDISAEIEAEIAGGSDKTRMQLAEEKLQGNFEIWYGALCEAVNSYLAD